MNDKKTLLIDEMQTKTVIALHDIVIKYDNTDLMVN